MKLLIAALLLTIPGAVQDFEKWWAEGGERVRLENGRIYVNADNARMPGGGVATVWRKQPLPAEPRVSSLHPRIYVRHDHAIVGQGLTVSQWRARLQDMEYARFKRRALAIRGASAIVERAARYLEDGNSADLELVSEFLRTQAFSLAKHGVSGLMAGAEMAIALDWTYAGLSPSDRASAMANIVTTADSSQDFLLHGDPDINHNYTYMAMNTLAVCGLVLKGEPVPFHQKAIDYLALAERFLAAPGMALDTWNAREGAWAEGSHYTFHETLRNFVLMLLAYRSAGDLDYLPLIERVHGNFLWKAGRFLMASTRPDMTFERIGDSSASRVTANLTVPLTVEMIAAGLSDRDEVAQLRSFSDALLKTYGEQAVHPAFDWGMRIFFDPRAAKMPSYQTLPQAMRLGAGTYEHLMFRNGWTPASTLITILAGDHFTDHQHFDKGQFLIYHRGGLAVDSGAYDQMYQPGQHSNEYAPRTLAHNCLLVFDPAEPLPEGYTNDGGQIIHRGKQHHGDWPTYIAHRVAEGLHAAEVLAYDQDAQHAYARVDLKAAYGPKVISYDRQFVYLREPDYLLVYDRVRSAQPDFKKRWLLHFQEQPLVDGRAPEAGVHSFAGAELVTARRGHGVLFVRTLLPAEHSITAVGGPGYEYYSLFTGKNYPVSKPAVASEVREAGTWRIEVSPNQPAAYDEFLHALQIADGETRDPAPARLIKAGQAAGIQQGKYVVIFSNGAPLPLRYEVSAPARHLLVGLPPQIRVVIQAGGKTISDLQVNAQGLLAFDDTAAGPHEIVVR